MLGSCARAGAAAAPRRTAARIASPATVDRDLFGREHTFVSRRATGARALRHQNARPYGTGMPSALPANRLREARVPWTAQRSVGTLYRPSAAPPPEEWARRQRAAWPAGAFDRVRAGYAGVAASSPSAAAQPSSWGRQTTGDRACGDRPKFITLTAFPRPVRLCPRTCHAPSSTHRGRTRPGCR